MVVALSGKSQTLKRKYVLKAERDLPEDQQTVFFYVRPTRADQQNVLSDLGKATVGMRQADALLLACLVKIDNLKDDEGKALEWEEGKQQQNLAVLDALPVAARMEVGAFIIEEMMGLK